VGDPHTSPHAGTYTVTENLVENVGDGCIAMNNNAFGLVSNNVLRSCNLGIGAGPAGQMSSAADSTPFSITGNLLIDCDYGVLLGWFGYKGRVGPINCIVSNNNIIRPRSCGIQNNGGPGAMDGRWIVQGNSITHAGSPATQPPHTTGIGAGHGILAVSLHDVQILGNQISDGRGDAITAMGLHFVISDNLLVANASTNNVSSGISVSDSVDVSVAGNTIRGFATAITVVDKDRLHVTGNVVDISHASTARGIVVGQGVKRVVVAGNTASGAVGGQKQCIHMSPALRRVSRDNVCWD
jgi:hypothetical protein